MKDVSVMIEGIKFNYRVATIIRYKNKVLLHKNKKDTFYAIPGGRIHIGEDSKTALKREVMEEMHTKIDIKNMISIIENFFNYDGKDYHEIMIVYESDFEDKSFYNKEIINGTEKGEQLDFIWKDVNELESLDIRPISIKRLLKSKDRDFTNIIEKCNKINTEIQNYKDSKYAYLDVNIKNRIDKELVERKMVDSRTKAQDLIKSGYVKCNGKIILKPNYSVNSEDKLEILENDKLKYVSRGGLKLEKAINEFNIDFKNKSIMDIGSSTGGFCDCALQHGAKNIIAVDVGTNLLHQSLRKNKKITLFEKTNFKNLQHKYFENIDFITCDVSFISLKHIVKKIYDENVKIEIICLIKPQFECGKEIADKYKGIVLNKDIHKKIINDLFEYFNSLNFYTKNLTYSPIKGGDGNIEYLVYLSNKINKNSKVNVEEIVNEAFKK